MKFIATKKATDTTPAEELLNEEFVTADEIIPKVKAIFAKGYKPDEVEVRIEGGEGTREALATVMAGVATKTRKSHVKKGEPVKKFRSRRKSEFFVFATGAMSGPWNREGLAGMLDGLEMEVRNSARVFPGPEIHFERKIQLTLKPAK